MSYPYRRPTIWVNPVKIAPCGSPSALSSRSATADTELRS
jgi:hypothetical protein